MRRRRIGSLLPGQAMPQTPFSEQPAPPHKAGAALQLDAFTLLVGRFLLWLGVIGTCIELVTSTVALMILFLSNPGPHSLGWQLDLAISVFLALLVETGQMTLVINLNDSWISLLSGHPEHAFITNGEVNRHLIILWAFEIGCSGINVWWNIVFFGDITTSNFLISLGTAGLLACSLLMWPLGMKVVRNAKRRILSARRVARQMMQTDEQYRIDHAQPIIVDATRSQHGFLSQQ